MRDDPNLPNGNPRTRSRPMSTGQLVTIAAMGVFLVLVIVVIAVTSARDAEERAEVYTPDAPLQQAPVEELEEETTEPEQEEGPDPEAVAPILESEASAPPPVRQIDTAIDTPAPKRARPKRPKDALAPPDKPREEPPPPELPEDALLVDRNAGIAPEDLRAVVSDHEAELAACYPPGVRSTREKIVVRIAVTPDGDVEAAELSGRRTDDLVATCIVRSARSWRFPAPGGDSSTEVEVPFVLVPGTPALPDDSIALGGAR